jgi:hypothetical protein
MGINISFIFLIASGIAATGGFIFSIVVLVFASISANLV